VKFGVDARKARRFSGAAFRQGGRGGGGDRGWLQIYRRNVAPLARGAVLTR
jgi:hypothetical protein